MSRYRSIQEEEAAFPVATLCRVLEGGRSGYYAWARRGVSARAQADADLTTQIAAVHARSRRTYGAPRVHADLRAAGVDGGVRCARTRVARLMRAARLVGCHLWGTNTSYGTDSALVRHSRARLALASPPSAMIAPRAADVAAR